MLLSHARIPPVAEMEARPKYVRDLSTVLIRLCMHVYINIHIYIYIHTYTHTHTNIYIYIYIYIVVSIQDCLVVITAIVIDSKLEYHC